MSIYIYRKMKLFWVMIFLLASFQLKAEFTFTPASPTVEVGQDITLSVSGTSGEITWTPSKGQIRGDANQATYIAPAQAGVDAVTLIDEAGNVGTVKIIVTANELVSLENATWKTFTNRDDIQALLLSEDGRTLWVGTNGGLEKRDATGELKEVFLSSDGFPNNEIQAIVNDNKGGLWVGTAGGLAHVGANGTVKAFTTADYDLPNDLIKSLLADGNGGVWIGAQYGIDHLAHLSANREWQIFTQENSGMRNYAYCLLSDGKNGIWMGNNRGLIHFDATGSWTVFNTENSQLPDNTVLSLESDGNNGLWVGTEEGLAHFHPESTTWSNVDNSKLPSNEISAIQSDGKGGIWLGTDKGLAYFQAGTIGQIYSVDNSDLPSNQITSIESDGNGGLWLGTSKGIAHLKSDENSLKLLGSKHFASTLPSNDIQVLSSSQDGIWVGTDNGRLHLNVDGTYESFHSEPFSTVSAIEYDNANGVWVGTEKGLFHIFAGGTQAIFNTEDSDLRVYSLYAVADKAVWAGTNFGLFNLAADNHEGMILHGTADLHVKGIQPDNNGGIWVGLGRAVLHIKADNTRTPFHFENSEMPNKWIRSLHADGDGGVWVGLGGDAKFTTEGVVDPGNCLVHIPADGDLKVIKRDDSGPQLCRILSIQTDGGNGTWVGFGSGGKNVNGKFFGGLGHLNAQGNWQFFYTNNSALPINDVTSLLSDKSGGIWVGTSSGLAHLTFAPKNKLCTQIKTETCDALLTGKRAAIIIAGGGAQSTNSLWETTEAISNRIYKVFSDRGFDKSEIYYLSSKPWADFDGDGFNDRITRTPEEDRGLIVEDVRTAFEWAKTGDKLDQPLYVFFVDHGGPNKLLLAKDTEMQASEFQRILDDYYNSTGNQVILVIEACYSGSLLETLAAPDRAIISSAKDDEEAYFVEKQGFTHFFTDHLVRGRNFFEAFNFAIEKQNKLLKKSLPKLSGAANSTDNKTQTPQLDDNADGFFTIDDGQWLKKVYVNGNFQTLDITLAVESLTTSTPLLVEQAIMLKAKATTAVGQVERVWAVVRPPKISRVLDSNGTPILAYPRFNLQKTEVENVWQTSWNDAVYNGDYDISFYAKDNEGNIASSDNSLIISVTGGAEPPEQANVQIVLEKDRYHPGEHLKAELIENLGWGYDLYAAVVMPDGNFMAFKNTNELAPLNEVKRWRGLRSENSHSIFADLTLPEDLAMGEYCLYGILSPEREDVFETQVLDLWVMGQQCFEVF